MFCSRKEEGLTAPIMGMWGLSVFILICQCVFGTSGLQYKCHRDICDASWQFCNDGEERCNTCTPEQCQLDVAHFIFNQCETFCKSLETTSAKLSTTEGYTTPDSLSRLPLQSQDAFIRPAEFSLLVVIFVTIVTFGVVSIYYLRQIKLKQEDCTEKGSLETISNTLSGTGEAEKAPLLETAVQATESGSHSSKLDDIQTLAHAAGSAPPSYSTNDNMRDRSQSPATKDEALPTGVHYKVSPEQDNDKCEDMGNTNLLTNTSLVESEQITRLKSV